MLIALPLIPPSRARRLALTLFVPCWAAAQAPGADSLPECRRLSTRTSLNQLTGQMIGSVRLEASSAVVPMFGTVPTLAGASRAAAVRRQLLFAPGDTVDTLRIAETLRRLRQERVFADVDLVATGCGG